MDILRCVFCGGESVRLGVYSGGAVNAVECLDCRCIGPKSRLDSAAVQMWNHACLRIDGPHIKSRRAYGSHALNKGVFNG